MSLAKASASAKVHGNAGLKAEAGPFVYRITKAKIQHNGTGLDWVFWRLDGAEFFQENRPDLVVIVQVPRETQDFKVHAAMQAYRYFNTLGAEWREAILGLPSRLLSFFENGAPVRDAKQYDLTQHLSS